jgi:hypothetical protein
MAFSIRPFRRFPAHCFVTLQREASPRQRHNLESFFSLPNEQCIDFPEAVVRWSRGQEFAVENLSIEPHAHARLQYHVKRLAEESVESIS